MRTVSGAVLAVSLLVAGCGDTVVADDVGAGDEASAPQADAGDGAAEVVLLTGAAPSGSVLRLHPAVGDVQTATMVQAMHFEVDDGTGLVVNDTETETRMRAEVLEVADDGAITLKTTYLDVRVVDGGDLSRADLAALEASIEPMVGLELTTKIDAQGRTLDVEIDGAEGLDPILGTMLEQLTDSMRDVSSPWPREAVEVGAAWRVDWPLSAMGLELLIGGTYELVALEGEDYVVDVVLGTAGDQSGTIEVPGAVGADVEVRRYDLEGSSRIVGSLDRVLAQEVRGTTTVSMEMVAHGPDGEAVEIDQMVVMEISLIVD